LGAEWNRTGPVSQVIGVWGLVLIGKKNLGCITSKRSSTGLSCSWCDVSDALFVWLVGDQPAVLFSQNKPAISNQPTVLFSQNKSAPATSQTNML
jgi:hypothetical protein